MACKNDVGVTSSWCCVGEAELINVFVVVVVVVVGIAGEVVVVGSVGIVSMLRWWVEVRDVVLLVG